MALEGSRARFFYGWRVVAGVFGVLFVGFGAAYSFGAFFTSLRDEFAATRGEVSLVLALTGFIYFGLGPVSGLVADRFGPRRVITAGVALAAAGMALASLAQELWQVYLTFSLGVGLGVGLAYVPAVGAVQRWFVRRRGMASGLAVAGIGAGTLAVPLLAAACIEALGWRQAYAVVGAAVLLIGLPAARLIEPSPEVRGLWPDGDARPVAGAGPAAGPGVREALRGAAFWLLFGSGLATSLGIFIPFAHLVPFAKDQGHSEAFGTLLIGLIGVGSIGGRLLLGGSADRLGRRRAQAATFTAMGCCLLWWLLVPGAWALVVFALAFGAAYGGFVALSPALAADYFAGRSFGAVLGLIYSAAAIGSLVGPTMAGALFDRTGSYDTPILVAVGLNAVAVGCMVLLREPPRAAAAQVAGAPAR